MPRVAPELQASAQSFCGAALRSEAFKRDARLNKSFVRAGMGCTHARSVIANSKSTFNILKVYVSLYCCVGARRMELYADEMKDIKNDNFLRSAFWEGDTRVDAAAAAQVCLVGLHCVEHYVIGPVHG